MALCTLDDVIVLGRSMQHFLAEQALSSCLLASPVLDACKQCMTFCEILLNFLASVEDGTVAGCAQNILMQATLAPLALGPKGTEGELKVIHCAECLLVHSAFLQPETLCVAGGRIP